MGQKLQSVKGMHDLLPSQSLHWQFIEHKLRGIARAYAYDEIRTPILEKAALFVQSIGEQTDIVEKEMFAFEDSGGDNLCMRPENTAAVVRAGVQHGLLHNTQARFWYMGPMFRRERPQKGRYRQFSQFGVEAFGWAGPEADAEVMLLSARVWQELGVKDVHLYLNSLGSDECRAAFRKALVNYLEEYIGALDADSKRRFKSNPLRILDSKNKETQAILRRAPKINDFHDEGSKAHIERVCELLGEADIGYTLDPFLVRGLDYYTSTVFEWKTTKLGAQNTVCAGGRYDNLVARSGGRATPATGFSMGMDRLLELLIEENNALETSVVDAHLITLGVAENSAAMRLAESLRDAGITISMNHGVGKLKAQLNKADLSGVKFALIMGETELTKNSVQIVPLRGQFERRDASFDAVAKLIKTN